MCISRRGWVTRWMSLCGPSAVSVLCKQRHFLLQAPSVSVRRSAADAQDCVEMLQPPKDVMLGLYSLKINSSSLNYFLPVVVWDILLSKRRFICSINTQSARCYDTQFTSGNVWVQYCNKYRNPVFCCWNRNLYRFIIYPFPLMITEFVLPIFSSASHVADCVSLNHLSTGRDTI